MRQFTKIVETTIIDDTGEEKTTRKTRHTLRNWQELSREEKEYQIEKHQESIYTNYQEYMYEIFKDQINWLKEDLVEIEFDDIYLDSNSQGWWIDRVKGLKLNFKDIEIYGETLYLDYYVRIRKLIEDITLYAESYYGLTREQREKIENTKKYKEWIEKAQKRVNEWVDRENDICSELGKSEYYAPYDLDDSIERDFLDNYFEDMEFEDVEELSEKDDIYV